jgi:hypothetical protein
MKRPGPGSALALAAALLLLILAMAAKPALIALPEAPARAAPGSFDTQRAMARLGRILGDQSPHPVDSPANDLVRGRLVAELQALGLSPVVTDRMDCNGTPRSRVVNCSRIRNVRATIGPAAGQHLLLVSHYDSTPVGPGAGDDGIGVAVMLEVASLLKDRSLARPITLLFNEGEEAGLNGARAFLRSDPLAAQVDSAINLEARGVTGPAIMFETSRPNEAALSVFKAASWRPVANSLTADFYRLIPNDTDVSVFKERNWAILNFAIIGNETRYHSPGDDIAALDRRSVRHMGEQALRAAVAMTGQRDAGVGRRVYADLLGRWLVTLPAGLAWALLDLLVLAAAVIAWRRRLGLGRAVGTHLAAIMGAGLACALLQFAIGFFRSGTYWRGHPEMIAVAIDILALAAGLAALTGLGRRCDAARLRSAYWLIFLVIGFALSMIAPGAVIFFLLPPAVALLGMAAGRRWPVAEPIAGLAAWTLLFLSWAPLIHLSEMLLDFAAGWIFAALGALMLLPALVELKAWMDRLPRRTIMAPVAVAAIAAWAAISIAPSYSQERKQPFGIEYVREARNAHWMVVNDGAPLPAAYSNFAKGVKVPWSSRRRWAAPAPLLPVAAPILEGVGEHVTPLGRRLRLRLHASGNDAVILRAGKDAHFIAARAGGAEARFGRGKGEEAYSLRCNGRACDGLVIDLLVGSRAPVPAKLIGIRYALPPSAKPLSTARPALAAPQYSPDSTLTVTDLRL